MIKAFGWLAALLNARKQRSAARGCHMQAASGIKSSSSGMHKPRTKGCFNVGRAAATNTR